MSLSPGPAILYGTLVVGALDLIDAIVFFGVRGVRPVRIFHSIAAGLLGRAAFQGGLATALLGALLVNGLLIHAFGVGLPSALFA